MTAPDWLTELRRLREGATPGPYEYDPNDPPWMVAWDNGTPIRLADVVDEATGLYLVALLNAADRLIAAAERRDMLTSSDVLDGWPDGQ